MHELYKDIIMELAHWQEMQEITRFIALGSFYFREMVATSLSSHCCGSMIRWSMPQLQLRSDVRSFAISKSMPWKRSVQVLRTMDQVRF